MDSKKDALLTSKIKSLVSSLYHLVLWFMTLPSPMQDIFFSTTPTLIRKERHINIRSIISSPSPSASPLSSSLPSLSSHSLLMESNHSSLSSSWSSGGMGDIIGTDSGVCVNSNEDIIQQSSGVNSKPFICKNRRGQKQVQERKKKYPPTIPLLAITGNLSGRMPWFLNREYIDGRLILKEAKVERYEYFEAQRGNGRLVLSLIPKDDTMYGSTVPNKEKSIKEEKEQSYDRNSRG